MHTINHTLYYPSRSTRLTMWHLSDLHIGHAAHDEKALKEDIAAIAADPYAFWGGGGDYGDFIPRVGDKRYRETSIAPWLWGKTDVCRHQVERFAELFRPIAGKCLYMLKGNHEDDVLSYYDRDVYVEIVQAIADMKGCTTESLALGWEGFVRLKLRRGSADSFRSGYSFVIYAHHGALGGRMQGGHALHMERTLLTYQCDLALLGHRHIRMVVNKPVIRPAGNGYEIQERVGVWCGSYLGSYIPRADHYGQRKQLPPTTVGAVPVEIWPDRKRITPLLSNGRCAVVEEEKLLLN